jgi:hypothetical protein
MPQFHPEHTPPKLTAGSFTQGYLDCAEWLLDEEINRDKIRGWTRKAVAQAIAICHDFQTANADALGIYYDLSGRDEASAGHDFFLSRNGHGAGFFDRGREPVFDQLQDAARHYGKANVECWRGWLIWY